jgi:hypothetical protein
MNQESPLIRGRGVVKTVRILPIKCFNYLGLATKSSKKLMKNQKKTALLKK